MLFTGFFENKRLKCVMIRILNLLLIIFYSNNLYAKDDFVTVGFGMVNLSFAESEVSIEEEENTGQGVETSSGSISVITLAVNYEVPLSINRTFFTKINVPLVGSGDSTYLNTSVGMNYFFNQINTDQTSFDRGTKFTIVPKFRYYVGAQIGSAYYVYTTETKKKSDVLIELGAQAGVLYAIGKRYGIHADVFFGRGTGVNTTTNTLKAMAAMIYKF